MFIYIYVILFSSSVIKYSVPPLAHLKPSASLSSYSLLPPLSLYAEVNVGEIFLLGSAIYVYSLLCNMLLRVMAKGEGNPGASP